MNLPPEADLARLVPFLRAWEEVQAACDSHLRVAPQILSIHWDGSDDWEPIEENLCPLLPGPEPWKCESQFFHYRQCIDALCGGESKAVTLFPCYCGLSHLVFPLKREGAVAGAVVCSAVATRSATEEEIAATADRVGQTVDQLRQTLRSLRSVPADELLRQSQRVAEKIPALERAFGRTFTPGRQSGYDSEKARHKPVSDEPIREQGSQAATLSEEPAVQLVDGNGNAPAPPPTERRSDSTVRSRQRRVVITGLGVVSSIGIGKESFAQALRDGRNGVGPITLFDPETLNSKIAGEVRNFRPEEYLDPKAIKRTGRSTQFAVAAAKQAIQDSGIDCGVEDLSRIGVLVGSAAGGLEFGQDQVVRYMEDGGRAISPFLSIIIFAGACSSEVSMELHAKGPSITVSTGCAASNDAFGYALQFIRDDKADIMIAGGTEAPIFPVMHASFCSLRALSTRNEDPEHASRPFDRDRDGFVIAEGSAMVVMEELDRARARGAHIYGEILGYAATGDAFHMTRPSPDGVDATRAIQLAIQDSGLAPEEIQYVSAHGSATPLNDRTETAAIKSVFGRRAYEVPVSSTKSMLGHSIGASGAFDLVAVLLGMMETFLPPTINLDNADPECDLDYVPNRSRDRRFEVALSNSFGFGGKNACIVLSKW